MSQVLRAARKESFVPGFGAKSSADSGEEGWKGGIPTRPLSTKIIDPETGKALRKRPSGWRLARPPGARSAAGSRAVRQVEPQRGAGVLRPGKMPGPGRFSELRRAASRVQRRGRTRPGAEQVSLLQQIDPVEQLPSPVRASPPRRRTCCSGGWPRTAPAWPRRSTGRRGHPKSMPSTRSAPSPPT